MSEPISLPSPAKGIDNVSSIGNAEEGTVRRADNVDIDRNGVVSMRRGPVLALAMQGLHSLHSCASGVYAIADSTLYRLDLNRQSESPIAPLNSNDPASYTDVPMGTVMVNAQSCILIRPDGSATDLAPEDAAAPSLSVADNGGLAAGQYGVAIAYMIGNQEGALSPAAYIKIDDGQGIRIDDLPAARSPLAGRVRVYRTSADGNTFYLVDTVRAGGAYPIGNTTLRRRADNRFLSAFVGGDIVRFWNGRLLVAQGDTLRIGEPFRHGLYSPREGFIQRPAPIIMVAATDSAVFVATDDGKTVALTGRRPDEWAVNNVDAGRAFPNSDQRVSLDTFSEQWATSSATGAVWLTSNGYVVGLPDGTIVAPQKRRLRIEAINRANTVVIGRRLFTG